MANNKTTVAYLQVLLFKCRNTDLHLNQVTCYLFTKIQTIKKIMIKCSMSFHVISPWYKDAILMFHVSMFRFLLSLMTFICFLFFLFWYKTSFLAISEKKTYWHVDVMRHLPPSTNLHRSNSDHPRKWFSTGYSPEKTRGKIVVFFSCFFFPCRKSFGPNH